MADGDRLDLVVPQEPCHPGVMGALGPLVVQCSPADRELLPAGDLAVDDAATATRSACPQRGSTWPPAVIGTHTLISNASLSQRHLAGRPWCCPDLYRTNATACFGTLALPACLTTACARTCTGCGPGPIPGEDAR